MPSEDAQAVAAQLRAVLDSIADCYYAVDRNWTVVEFSKSAETYFRLTRDQVVGRNLWELFPQGLGQAYETTCRAAMDRGEMGRLEAPSALRPGNVVEMRTLPWPGGISVVIADITAKRRAEAETRKQSRQLQAVLDAAPIAIWISRDTAGDDIVANRFARQLLRQSGAPPNVELAPVGPLPGVRAFAAAGDAIEGDALPIRRAARGQPVLDWELRLQFDEGEEIDLFGNAVPLVDHNGTPRGSVAAFVDVTRLKSAERELQALLRSLESRVAQAVAEREAALGQLHEAQKMEALGQITGGVAHDFNNLLAPIIGGLSLLRKHGVGTDRDQRLIDGALQSAERAKVLVQRMLAFARRQPLEQRAVDLTVLIEGLAGLLSSTIGPLVRLHVQIAPSLPPVLADPGQLELALLNLAINARDAMPEGGTLTITAAVEDGARDDASFIRLAVTDTGVGMDEATLRRAVEPFFTSKPVGKGTGLGLSMVHGLAAQLGGRLELSSMPMLGTTVSLVLPAAPEGAVRAVAHGAASQAASAGSVLLVDDDVSVRETTRALLEDLGYAVTEAISGEQAWRLLSDGLRPDWLVTDFKMPGMTGAELARTVAQHMPAIRLLLISGYADVEGFAADLPRLAKPFTGDELAARMRR